MDIKKNPIFRRALYCFARIASAINEIVPKDENLILFYDSNNTEVVDNTEAIYNYIKQNDRTGKKLVLCASKNNLLEAVKGALIFLRAKYMFYSFGDFRIAPSSKQVVVFQQHGSPFKTSGAATGYGTYTKEKIDNFTFSVVSASIYIPIMERSFMCKPNQIKVLGQARNDYFFSHNDGLKGLGIDRSKYKKLLLWMPTFRKTTSDARFHDGEALSEETGLPLISTQEQLKSIDKYLNEIGLLLCIKLHPYSELKDNNLNNILTLKNSDILPKGVKLYEFVKEFDALLTDYSSISFDYIILDRPIGYTIDDIDKYTRGFCFENPTDYMGGQRINSIEELKTYFKDVADGNDPYKEDRHRVCTLTNTYIDGKSCQRLLDACNLVIN